MRAYTLEEIDRMRKAISAAEWSANMGWYADYDGPAEPVREFERQLPWTVEDKLRTYMAAGIDPAELEKPRDAASHADNKEKS